jgi:hypothetical protein
VLVLQKGGWRLHMGKTGGLAQWTRSVAAVAEVAYVNAPEENAGRGRREEEEESDGARANPNTAVAAAENRRIAETEMLCLSTEILTSSRLQMSYYAGAMGNKWGIVWAVVVGGGRGEGEDCQGDGVGIGEVGEGKIVRWNGEKRVSE